MSDIIIYDSYNISVTIDEDVVIGVSVVEGFIHDVIAGTNISIDKTDPLNPIISATGGGQSYTFTSGLTESGGTVKWNGAITQNTTINSASAHTLSFGSAGNELGAVTFLLSGTNSFGVSSTGANTAYITGIGDNIGSIGNGSHRLLLTPTSIGIESVSGSYRFATDTSGASITLGSDATNDMYYRNSSGYITRIPAGANTTVLTSNSGVPTWTAPNTSFWSLSTGGTLTGANTITGTTTNILKGVFNGLSTTQTNGAGLWLANTTSAGAGAQQISPSLVLEGQGWRTNATAESQSVKFMTDVLPVQGTANPSGTWRLMSSINGAAYVNRLQMTSGDAFTIGTPTSNSSTVAVNTVSFGSIQNQATISMGTVMSFHTQGVGACYNFSAGGTPSAVFATYVPVNNWYSHTSGTANIFHNSVEFRPTSGTAVINYYNTSPVINQSGGANGHVTFYRGAPTVTAAVNVTGYDWNPTVTSITGTHLSFRATGGNMLLPASSYINFGTTSGSSGYGFRDNAGVMEFKNSGGAWTAL